MNNFYNTSVNQAALILLSNKITFPDFLWKYTSFVHHVFCCFW